MDQTLDAEDEEKLSCEVASKVLKKKTLQLRNSLVVDEMPENLYASELITFEVFENISTDKTKTELSRLFLFDVLRTVQHEYGKFEELCDVLEKYGDKSEKKLASTFRENYIKELSIAREKYSKSGPIELEKLKENLRMYAAKKANPEAPNVDDLVKYDLSEYIKGRLQNKIEKRVIAEEMRSLCYDEFLVPEELSEWWERKLNDLYLDLSKASPVSPKRKGFDCNTEPTPPEPISQAELKDMVYHSCLCCQMVNSCSSKDYGYFFDNAENLKHSFTEVSMSILRDGTERYVIAKQKDAIYLAFLSEPNISDWLKKYTSFDQGLLDQMNRFPIQYLEEEILAKKRIILTGFSFGGMLACYITANLWSQSMFSIQDLQKSVTCITFGQPFIDAPFVEGAIQNYVTMKYTLHAVYDEGDLFPIILHYVYQHRSSAISSSISHVTQLTSAESKEKFQDEHVGSLLRYMDSLQDKASTSSGTTPYSRMASKPAHSKEKVEKLENLESTYTSQNFSEGISKGLTLEFIKDISLYSHYCYVIQQSKKADENGSVWKVFPTISLAFKMFQSKLREVLDEDGITPFKKHNIAKYRSLILNSFVLEKPEEYRLPHLPDKVKCNVDNFKPDVKSAVIHMYPSEHIVVLEGNQLLFCSNIHLGEKDYLIKLDKSKSNWKMTSKMIQINYVSPQTEKTKYLVSKEKMRVVICSHFCNPIRKEISVKEESFSFTPRQTQIAKYSPSQVIELAFLSAMLEQYTLSIEKPSQRFLQIKSFLEKAVQIVPLESIFVTIGYASIKISVACAKTLYDSKVQFQPSPLVLDGLKLASFRMSTGLSADEYDSITMFVYRNLPYGVMPNQVIIEVTPHRVGSISKEDCKINYEVLKHGQGYPYVRACVDFYFCNENKNESTNKTYAEYFSKMAADTQQKILQNEFVETTCGPSIDRLYPIMPSVRRQGHPSFQSPLVVLREAREKIALFIEEKTPNSGEENPQSPALHNEDMLSVVRDVLEHSLKMCAELLGSFMEQQIRIPLIKDGKKTMADKLSSSSSHLASIGCWALYSSTFDDLLLHLEGNPIVVELADYFYDFLEIKNVPNLKLKHQRKNKRSQYSEKLFFLLVASKLPMSTVTCSSEYISYSLERQICKRFEFTKKETLPDIIKKWDSLFQKDALVFVHKSFRPIIGRWLKWATLIYDLRECLAKYTCVGVTGLVNSGKSQLVSKLFKIKTKVGISAAQRTTVPMLYNLEDKVPGLDIIDFPGFDDKEHSIPEIADLFLGLTQIIIFVCDHKRTSCDAAKQWLEVVRERENIPVIICMTFADELYSEIMKSENNDPNPTEVKKRKIRKELEIKRKEIGFSYSTDYYCFDIPPGRTAELNSENFGKVGINSVTNVGLELVKIFEKEWKQPKIAENLNTYIQTLK